MNRNILFALLAVSMAVGCATQNKYVKPSSRPLNKVELKFISQDFDLLYRKVEMPNSIIALVSPIAEIGERFNSTDMVEEGLLSRRIVFGGKSENMDFLFLDQGGFVPDRRLLIFNILNEKVEPLGEYVFPSYVDNIDDIKTLLKEKAYEYYDERKWILSSNHMLQPTKP